MSTPADPFGQPCECRCHANSELVEPDPTRTCSACGTSWTVEIDTCPHCGAQVPCCDLHNRNCEPPGDLCCHLCTEATHDAFPIRHADGSTCVLEAR